MKKVVSFLMACMILMPFTLFSAFNVDAVPKISQEITESIDKVEMYSKMADELQLSLKKESKIFDYIDETERLIAESNEQAGVENDPEPVNGLHQTNLGVFRAYLERYLRSLAGINQEMMLMVRQLQPTEKGLPVELYFFSKVTEWTVYEKVQADVFDHVLAVIPEFGLRVFQNPAGSDVRDLKGEI